MLHGNVGVPVINPKEDEEIIRQMAHENNAQLPLAMGVVVDRVAVIVDGSIRSGWDLFKAYTLGADLCLICRSVLVSYYGCGQEGIECYLDKPHTELKDTMYMCEAKKSPTLTVAWFVPRGETVLAMMRNKC